MITTGAIKPNVKTVVAKEKEPKSIPKRFEVTCGACLENDYNDSPEIRMCELCGVAVHLTCYGSSPHLMNPDKESLRLCDRCENDYNPVCSKVILIFICRIIVVYYVEVIVLILFYH